MTEEEIVRRCVELVWDFGEIYDNSDIEDFCSKELRTYPQHDKIVAYLNQLTEKDKQIEELKGDLELWESGACRKTNLDKCGVVKQLEAQIEKMKSCRNCENNCCSNWQKPCRDCTKHSNWKLKE